MRIVDAARAALDTLEHAGLLREPVVVTGTGPTTVVRGRRALNLCSNNYLGLADDPRLVRELIEALRSVPQAGAAASRLVSGTSEEHLRCERELAAFIGAERALFFSTGYAANAGSIPALVTNEDVIFSDALNHASLIDGCRLARANVVIYPHGDIDALRSLMKERRRHARLALVVTESVFSMDGDRAPLSELRALCDELDATLFVDEAHSLGVFGDEGRGLCAALNVVPDVLVGPLGKAFGASGAFVAATANVIRLLENRARTFVFSTAPPPLIATMATQALTLVRQSGDRRERLHANAAFLRDGLRAASYEVRSDDSPILAVHVGEPEAAVALSNALFERGIFVQAIRPPTVPPGTARLRVVPIATHTHDQLEQALEAFRAVHIPARPR